MAFLQEDFTYQCLFTENTYLKDIVKHYADKKNEGAISDDLKQFSERAGKDILQLMWQAEKNLPELIQFNCWGQRIDEIRMDSAWTALHEVAAREGMLAIGYERKSKEDSRLHQFLKLMIFHPSSAFYTCPLAMTDGAARVLELENGPLHKEFFNKLVSRDPQHFWTAGQWMTETIGGSDVSQSETRAELRDGAYYLNGVKWFTSAITANIAMTLAQTEAEGKVQLSMFLVEVRNKNGELNNIEVLRLKDKLGTRAMPTAELKLNGVKAYLIGELGSGIKNISTVLNITRLYNSVCATGTLYRLHSLIRDFSKKRYAFGKKIIDHALHQKMLIETQATTNACVHFCAELGRLLGRSEVGVATQEEINLLRLMTPIAKLWIGKKTVSGVSELIEAFGGAGYIEDTHLPRFLRDSQVFTIWEGTTNIMSLDALRALSKDLVFEDTFNTLTNRLQAVAESEKLKEGLIKCKEWFLKNRSNSKELECGAREMSFLLGDIFAGVLMLEFAEATKNFRDQFLANTFTSQIVIPSLGMGSVELTEVRQTLLS